jgi:phytoene dehydrogenase-like protein
MRPISRASSTQDVLGIGSAPLRGSVGLPLGSMGSIVDSLTLAARANGVNIRVKSPVTRLETDDRERVRSVVLESGERIAVDAAVVTIEPSLIRGMLEDAPLPDHLWPEPPSGSAFKVALALDGLPEVAGAPDGVPPHTLLAAQFRVGLSPDHISAAVEDGLAGRPSAAPLIWGLIPSVSSPGLAPPGKHLMSLNVWHAPHSLGRQYWREHGDAFVRSCLTQLEVLFPGLTERVTDVRWFSPHDLETEFNLTGSNITHGDMLPPQLLDGRPGGGLVTALRDRGIVLGGAGCWPGGYVTGIPGRNAAVAAQGMVTKREKEKR